MKRFIVMPLLLIFLFSLSPKSFAFELSVSAQAAVLIDVNSGRILYQKEADLKLPIASLTKIMTAIVAIEESKLTDMVVVGPNAVGAEGSSIYLRLGEKLSLEDMLYGLMLRSGNDAAISIAEHVGGSVDGFAFLMNEKAAYLGLNNSHFVNPHGLDHADHYSSAKDLAILTAYALKNPVFQKIVSTQVKSAPLEGKPWERKWYNKNKMLRIYEGANGVKTGFTKIAKRCLVSSATRDGRQLAVVVLNDGNDWNDSARLLDYGFSEFQEVEIVRLGQIVENEIKNRKAPTQYITLRSSKYPFKEGEVNDIHTEVWLIHEKRLFSNVLDGYLKVFLKDKLIDSVPLALNEKPATAQIIINNRNSFWESWKLFWRAIF